MRRGYPRGEQVIVHTMDGHSYAGILVGTYRKDLVLRHVQLRQIDGDIDMDGDLTIPRENVSVLQTDLGRPTPAARAAAGFGLPRAAPE